MLGLRGVRLGIVIPGLFTMQVRAILEAAAERIADGGDPQPEIMIPLVASVTELDLVKRQIAEVAHAIEEERGRRVPHKVGTMIELPRAAVTANEIAKSAEFFSFGTNDLTQMTWGFSRDDVESSFFSSYLEHGIFQVSPFESPRHRRRRPAGAPRRADSVARPTPTSTSGSAASTAATPRRSTSSTRSGSTTCPARRSGCRSPGSRPAARPWAEPAGRARRRPSASPVERCRDLRHRHRVSTRSRDLVPRSRRLSTCLRSRRAVVPQARRLSKRPARRRIGSSTPGSM